MAFGRSTVVALLALLFTCASCTAANLTEPTSHAQQESFEQAAEQYLPGVWDFQYSNIDPKFEIVGTSTYLSDGTARYKGRLVTQGNTIPLKFAATWSVKGNKMITVVTESSVPHMVPVGTESTDTIHELTSSAFRYTGDEEGITVTETRAGP